MLVGLGEEVLQRWYFCHLLPSFRAAQAKLGRAREVSEIASAVPIDRERHPTITGTLLAVAHAAVFFAGSASAGISQVLGQGWISGHSTVRRFRSNLQTRFPRRSE